MTDIAVVGTDIVFDSEEGETVLEAAERAGYAIPYSCRKGVCSSCEGRIVAGEASVRGLGVVQGPAERVLLCQARATTDIVVEPEWIKKDEPVVRKMFEAKVARLTYPNPDVAVIKLRLPIGLRAPFKAGQYLRIVMPDGDSRNYSMANPPQKNDEIELHIRRVTGGKFSETMLRSLEKNAKLKIELPYGQFCLSDNDSTAAILLASGTGFAPMKSIIENQIRTGGERQLRLYWGTNSEADLYMADVANLWAQDYSWFSFVPVVSGPSENWRGRIGLVHKAVQEDFADMSDVEVYACGAPVMIDAAVTDFVADCKLDRAAFFSDAFVASSD